MAYKVKGDKLTTATPKLGEVIFTSCGQDALGNWWWIQTDEAHQGGPMDVTQLRHGGPFNTQQEAEKNATDTIFGPQCKIMEGGRWDPAWERKQ